MKISVKHSWSRWIKLGVDCLFFVVSVSPGFYEYLSSLFLAEDSSKVSTAVFLCGSLLGYYAVITAVVQKHSQKRLAGLRQYAFRRFILFVAAYFNVLSLVYNLQVFTGTLPKQIPFQPEPADIYPLIGLISSIAGLVLTVMCYKFLGKHRAARSSEGMAAS